MMSKKCKYALKALIRLGKEYGGGNLLTDDIAISEHIPKKFLEQILLDLKHAGYVRSKQGSKGGYRLVQEPSQITLAEIHRLFDGAIALVPCVSQKLYEACDDCVAQYYRRIANGQVAYLLSIGSISVAGPNNP
jgi:Rrf2 family protein